MKKLAYSILLSSIAVVSANAHEIWLDLDDKKNEAKLFLVTLMESKLKVVKNLQE